STTDPNCQVQYSSSMVSIPANTQTAAPGLSVTVTRLATAPAGTQCSFNLQVLDVGYTSGNNKVIATIPVTVTDPPVPVPEFPTVAVSILTLSGMFVAVQFLRKRN
ncbi:MAG TPA: hypothetical protein VEI51_06500, partial [Methanomicrobiales archaeon]|nr:hypothetical protein [Methanomicrobiales archaeon]